MIVICLQIFSRRQLSDPEQSSVTRLSFTTDVSHSSSRNSLVPEDYVINRSSRTSLIPDTSCSNLIPEAPHSQRHSMIPDSSLSPRNSLVPLEFVGYNRSPRDSVVPETSGSRISLISDSGMNKNQRLISDTMRSPRGSIINIEYDRNHRSCVCPDNARLTWNNPIPMEVHVDKKVIMIKRIKNN
jgi:hypothetical protein